MYPRKKSMLIGAAILASCIFSPSVYATTDNGMKTTVAHSNIKSMIMSNHIANLDRSETRKETLSKARMTKLSDQQIASSITYKVAAGDTLTKIAKKFNVSVEEIVRWNQLPSADKIYVGQILNIYASSTGVVAGNPGNSAGNQIDTSANEEALKDKAIEAQLAKERLIETNPSDKGQAIYKKAIEIAKTYLGVPYLFGGNTPDGFDCSGFVRYVYANAGLDILRKSSEDYFMQDTTKVKNPVPGDLVFFKHTYKAGVSHMGIYLGDGKFIHAGNDGVEISNVSADYWKKHFVAYKRFNGIK